MYELIEHKVLDSTTATVTFSNIPNIYSDLYLVASGRTTYTTTTDSTMRLRFNNDTTASYVVVALYGNGSSALGFGNTYDYVYAGFVPTAITTANTFSSSRIRIADYASSSLTKEVSIENVHENNSSSAYMGLIHSLWNKTDPINEIDIYTNNNPYVQYSSFTLYGVGRRQGIGRAPLAIGGYAAYDNGYWYHSFPSSGSFEPLVDMDVEYLVIGGGGGGGGGDNGYPAGGGGAGGYRSSVSGESSGGGQPAELPISLSATTIYPVVVGAGGAKGVGTSGGASTSGTNGGDSSFSTITATGGGGGGAGDQQNAPSTGLSGGSGGGGGSGPTAGAAGGSAASGQGFDGGGARISGYTYGGGGGGASEIGDDGNTDSGNGGSGVISSITGVSVARAGGGGAGTFNSALATGGYGGGGNGGSVVPAINAVAGQANTGGGGGGGGDQTNTGRDSAAGGSGIVIVRYRA